jgi:ABC-type dipeptide/oligopeptide/nickel transport system permease subunit
MIGDGKKYGLSAPWLLPFPGLTIVSTIGVFRILEGLRDPLREGFALMAIGLGPSRQGRAP